jgi:hypothetical protein
MMPRPAIKHPQPATMVPMLPRGGGACSGGEGAFPPRFVERDSSCAVSRAVSPERAGGCVEPSAVRPGKALAPRMDSSLEGPAMDGRGADPPGPVPCAPASWRRFMRLTMKTRITAEISITATSTPAPANRASLWFSKPSFKGFGGSRSAFPRCSRASRTAFMAEGWTVYG